MKLGLSALLFIELSAAQTVSPPPAKYPDFPSETPAKFEPVTDSFDYVRRDVMIPMRDGVKLHTVILVPKGAKRRAHPADAHALQRHGHHQPRGQLAPRPDPQRLRQRHRGDRRRRLHPRRRRTCAASTAPRATT